MARLCGGVAIAAVLALPAAAAPADGFAAFWTGFAAAAARNDGTALASMVAIGPGLGDYKSFAAFHAQALNARARRCLASAKPTRDVGGAGPTSYEAFCGETIFGFTKVGGTWKLTDLGVND